MCGEGLTTIKAVVQKHPAQLLVGKTIINLLHNVFAHATDCLCEL